jgi:hypothetical protein
MRRLDISVMCVVLWDMTWRNVEMACIMKKMCSMVTGCMRNTETKLTACLASGPRLLREEEVEVVEVEEIGSGTEAII